VVRKWYRTSSGRRRLRMTSGCSSSSECTPGWTNWPYTDDNRYSNDDSDDSDDSGDSDEYQVVTSHKSCSATECRAPTGKFDHFYQYITIRRIGTPYKYEYQLMLSVTSGGNLLSESGLQIVQIRVRSTNC